MMGILLGVVMSLIVKTALGNREVHQGLNGIGIVQPMLIFSLARRVDSRQSKIKATYSIIYVQTII